jgi:hypothetical protein
LHETLSRSWTSAQAGTLRPAAAIIRRRVFSSTSWKLRLP